MADRRVSVFLDAEVSSYKRKLAEAAAATSAFDRQVDGSGKAIDKFSGRLRLLADAAVTLGPALIPIGASAIPALTAGLAGLGAAGGALGVTILAFKGLGDGLKALNAYQLEPTTENLQAMRVEMEKLGPAGAHFTHFIDDLGPVLSDLQMTAREGLFPGVEDGITDLLTRLPQVKRIVADLAEGMGDLARDAGRSLSSDDWTPFFNYIESDARPTLEAFAHSAGNVALGVANMLTAFAPLSRDFTGGLEDATAAFAEWSKHLDDNESFQAFLDYVAKSGPEVVDLLSALAQALVGLIQAAAPMGQVVLPALTGIAKAFALIAQSPIGPALYTSIAAMLAFNRVASITAKTTTSLSTAFAGMSRAKMAQGAAGGLGLLALSLTDVDEKAGLANTGLGAMAGLMVGGPWGLAIGAGIGQVLDFKDAYDQAADAIEAAGDAMRDNDAAAMAESLKALQDQLGREHPGDHTLANYMDAVVGSFHDFTGQTGDVQARIAELKGSMKQGGGIADLFGETIGKTGKQMLVAAGDAQALSGALAELSGWFDKREAIRNYKDSIDALSKSLKDGFSRDDAVNLDAVGRNILQIADKLGEKRRPEFLAAARQQLEDLATHSGPAAQKAIQEVIDKFDDKGLTNPPPAELTADDRRLQATLKKNKGDLSIMGRSVTEPTFAGDDSPFRAIYGSVKGAMRDADRLRANPKVSVDAGNSFDILGSIARAAKSIDTYIPITVSVSQIGRLPTQHASGGYTGDGGKYEVAGIVHRGEVVLPQEVVKRDWSMLRGRYGHLPGMAEGGIAGNTYTSRHARGDDSQGIQLFVAGTWSAAKALKALKAELDRAQKALEREKQSRDDLIQASKDFAAQVGGAYSSMDPFAQSSGSVWSQSSNPLAIFDAAVAGNTANTQAAQAALGTAAANGLDGALYQALASSGNLQLLQSFANLSAAEIDAREKAFAQQSAAQAGLGASAVGPAGFTAQIKESNQHLKVIETRLHILTQAVKAGAKETGDRVAAGVNGAASNGHRRGHRR